jgi:hypothetical protein
LSNLERLPKARGIAQMRAPQGRMRVGTAGPAAARLGAFQRIRLMRSSTGRELLGMNVRCKLKQLSPTVQKSTRKDISCFRSFLTRLYRVPRAKAVNGTRFGLPDKASVEP